MNARSRVFEFSCESRQIEEVVLSLFHTVVLHRTTGKFTYKMEGSYIIGTVGIVDVDCDSIDLTYVRCDSEQLHHTLKRQVQHFGESLRQVDGPRNGYISLEFFQKRKSRFFGMDVIPWEVWTIKLNIISLSNEQQRQICREKLGDSLSEKVMYIAEVMNRPDYVPKMPNQTDLNNVFDTSFDDVQPYLHRATFLTSDSSNTSVGSTVRKLLRDTFTYS